MYELGQRQVEGDQGQASASEQGEGDQPFCRFFDLSRVGEGPFCENGNNAHRSQQQPAGHIGPGNEPGEINAALCLEPLEPEEAVHQIFTSGDEEAETHHQEEGIAHPKEINNSGNPGDDGYQGTAHLDTGVEIAGTAPVRTKDPRCNGQCQYQQAQILKTG